MNTSFLKGTVGLLVFTGAMAVGPAGGVQLRYAFEKAKIYKYKTKMEFFTDSAKEGNAASAKPSAEISIGVSLSVTTISSTRDQRWKFVVDTVGMRTVNPGGNDRELTFGQLKGKSMELVIDDRGVPKSVHADDPSTLNQTRELGFELFSRDLLNISLIFPEFPDDSIETNRPWQFWRADTTSRGGQKLVVTRTTECKVVGTAMVGNQMCHKIAYTVIARIRSQSVNGETTGTGLLHCTERGIPIKSEASIKVVLSAGGSQTIQKRTVKTILE